jgi:phosphomannomutase
MAKRSCVFVIVCFLALSLTVAIKDSAEQNTNTKDGPDDVDDLLKEIDKAVKEKIDENLSTDKNTNKENAVTNIADIKKTYVEHIFNKLQKQLNNRCIEFIIMLI